jgi:hypothetical protein
VKISNSGMWPTWIVGWFIAGVVAFAVMVFVCLMIGSANDSDTGFKKYGQSGIEHRGPKPTGMIDLATNRFKVKGKDYESGRLTVPVICNHVLGQLNSVKPLDSGNYVIECNYPVRWNDKEKVKGFNEYFNKSFNSAAPYIGIITALLTVPVLILWAMVAGIEAANARKKRQLQ